MTKLTPKAQALLDASPGERTAYIRRRRRLGYPQAISILGRIRDLVDYQYEHRSLGLTLTAEQHQGKTTLLDWAHDETLRTHSGAARGTVSSIRLDVSSQWTVTSLYNACLRELGAPYAMHGDPESKFQTLKMMLVKKQTRLILIDECHDIRRTQSNQMRIILSGLRAICNLPGVTIVLGGLPDLRDIVRNDAQLSSRFEHHMLNRWQEGPEYYNLVFTLLTDLPIHGAELLFKTYPELLGELLTSGKHVLGGFSRLLTEAACLCLTDNQGVLTGDHIRRTADKFWLPH